MPERELYIMMETIDPDHSNYGDSSDEPIFFSRSPYKIIPLKSNLSIKEMVENPELQEPVTYYDILDEIFR